MPGLPRDFVTGQDAVFDKKIAAYERQQQHKSCVHSLFTMLSIPVFRKTRHRLDLPPRIIAKHDLSRFHVRNAVTRDADVLRATLYGL